MPTSKGPVRKRLAEQVDPGARRHGRRDRHDPVVLLRLLDQGVGEHLGVARRVGRRLVKLAGDDIELADAVIPVGGGLGRLVALALLGDAVNQDRAALRIVADVFQNRDQVVQIVPVDRADIVEAQFLEQGAAGQEAAGILLRPLGRALDLARELLGQHHGQLPDRPEAARRDQPAQIRRQPAHRRRDRHVVIVQDDDQARARDRRVVHRLIGHAGAHGAVADHGDDVAAFLFLQFARHRETQAGGNRGRTVRGAERVVDALRPFGKAVEAAALADRTDPVAPLGEDLVGIALMADIPDQDVFRRIEQIMDRRGQFDDAEPGAEMASGNGYGLDCFGPQFVGELAQLLDIELAQIGGRFDRVEQWRLAFLGHIEPSLVFWRVPVRCAGLRQTAPHPAEGRRVLRSIPAP